MTFFKIAANCWNRRDIFTERGPFGLIPLHRKKGHAYPQALPIPVGHVSFIYIYISIIMSSTYIYSFISLQIGQCRCDLTEHLWNKMGKLEWPMQVEQGTGIRSLESFIPRSAPWLNWSQRNVEISYHSSMVSWGCLICLHTKK